MMGLINVGDEVTTLGKGVRIVTSVETGEHGLMWTGADSDATLCWGFLPWELAPIAAPQYFWRGWLGRGTLILANGIRVGQLAQARGTPHSLEYLESEWECTLQEMKDEPMGCISLAEIQERSR